MSTTVPAQALRRLGWVCNSCRTSSLRPSTSTTQHRSFSRTSRQSEEVVVRAAPEIDFSRGINNTPARVIPASPSYFTGSPVFTDNLLRLQKLEIRHSAIPTIASEFVPRMSWLRLSQYRSATGEKVGASQYAKLLRLLTRLNRIHPQLRPDDVTEVLSEFQRPGSQVVQRVKAQSLDENGRAVAVGRRKTSSAQVHLVEGSGEVLINGKSILQTFPRLHDRESVLWPLKVTERMDKYNVFALVSGGGITGQAEAVTLGLAKALLIHEPALKPILRRAGCVTRDPRAVERKKPGRRKARKGQTWVKR